MAIQTSPTPAPASETPPRSRGLTEYFVFLLHDEPEDGDLYQQAGLVKARSPSGALDAARENDLIPDDGTRYVAVPVSSWHVFQPTLSFEEIK